MDLVDDVFMACGVCGEHVPDREEFCTLHRNTNQGALEARFSIAGVGAVSLTLVWRGWDFAAFEPEWSTPRPEVYASTVSLACVLPGDRMHRPSRTTKKGVALREAIAKLAGLEHRLWPSADALLDEARAIVRALATKRGGLPAVEIREERTIRREVDLAGSVRPTAEAIARVRAERAAREANG